jgi:hypothetical protein
MMLIELNSRSEALGPHALSEKVFWPFVVHSQILAPAGGVGCTGAAANAGAGMAAEEASGAGAGAAAGEFAGTAEGAAAGK